MIGLTILTVVLYTLIALLFKIAAARTNPERMMTVATAVVSLCAFALMALLGEWGGSWKGGLVALGAGALFYLASVYQLKALKSADTSLVFTVSSLNLIMAGMLLIAIPIFGVRPTPGRWLAMAVAGAALLVTLRMQRAERLPVSMFIALVLLTLCSVAYTYYARFFASMLFYIAINHLAGVLFNWRQVPSVTRADLQWGAGIGLCMFFAFWCLLEALAQSGEHSPLVLLALNIRTPLTALLAVPLFKERMTREKLLAVGLSSGALILWALNSR